MASQHGTSSALERLLSKLGLPREPYRADLQLFPELDVARLKRELRLEELGVLGVFGLALDEVRDLELGG